MLVGCDSEDQYCQRSCELYCKPVQRVIKRARATMTVVMQAASVVVTGG